MLKSFCNNELGVYSKHLNGKTRKQFRSNLSLRKIDTDFKGIKKTRIIGDIYRKGENKKQKKRAQHSHQLKSYSPYFQTNAVHSAQI